MEQSADQKPFSPSGPALCAEGGSSSKRGRPRRGPKEPITKEDVLKQLEEAERLELALLKKKEKDYEQNLVLTFKPHQKQQAFFAAVANAQKKVVIFQGGNRSGKTTSLIVAIVSLMLGYFPWAPAIFLRFKPPIKVRLFGEDWTHHVGQVLIPEIKKWMPASQVKTTKKNNQGIDYFWELKNGSILEIMTYEQQTDQVEGWSGHVVACDEPMPRDKYIANKRGLVDYNGVYLMAFTPLKEPWIKDELIDNR